MFIIKPSITFIYYTVIFNTALAKKEHLSVTLNAMDLPSIPILIKYCLNDSCIVTRCSECQYYKPDPRDGYQWRTCMFRYIVKRMLERFPLKHDT